MSGTETAQERIERLEGDVQDILDGFRTTETHASFQVLLNICQTLPGVRLPGFIQTLLEALESRFKLFKVLDVKPDDYGFTTARRDALNRIWLAANELQYACRSYRRIALYEKSLAGVMPSAQGESGGQTGGNGGIDLEGKIRQV
jgi:hypothetical protein